MLRAVAALERIPLVNDTRCFFPLSSRPPPHCNLQCTSPLVSNSIAPQATPMQRKSSTMNSSLLSSQPPRPALPPALIPCLFSQRITQPSPHRIPQLFPHRIPQLFPQRAPQQRLSQLAAALLALLLPFLTHISGDARYFC